MAAPGRAKATTLNQGTPIERAAQALNAGRLDEAERYCGQAISAGDSAAVALQLLGLIAHRRGDYGSAVKYLRESVGQSPGQAVWHFNLGVSCRAAGWLDEAEAAYRRAVELDEKYVAARYNLGSVLVALGRAVEARACFERVLALEPGHGNACYQLGSMCRDAGNIGKALKLLRRAVEQMPGDEEVGLALAVTLYESGRLEESRGLLEVLLASRPGFSEAATALVGVYDRLGMHDEARGVMGSVLEAEPENVGVLLAYADIAKRMDRVGDAAGRLEAALDAGVDSDDQRMLCHFALGKLHDLAGDAGRAFEHFNIANRYKPRAYDPCEHERLVDGIIRDFDRDALKNVKRDAGGDSRAVLIVGMPRSGTSLVEQILASHPEVAGGGELPELMNLARQARKIAGGAPLTGVLTQRHYSEMSRLYLAALDRVSKDAKRVTDKTPNNFLNLGLAALMLPGVRVIHCKRDALAACWSCYTQNFVGEHAYSYSLEHLGHYHRQYRRLMDHWRAVLGVPMLEVEYEKFVSGPEAAMRELVSFCGLPWSDDCARFYENPRPMTSASYDQVRRPIYTSSVDRWRRYEAHLGPLREALGVAA